jgi:Protein of unknown function (DUF2971)
MSMNSELQSDPAFIAPNASFLAANPELHHYTTLPGFKGIVESGTLWATHFADLNDASEVQHIKDPLISAVSAHFVKLVRERRSFRIRRKMEAMGGSLGGAANRMVNLIFKLLFDIGPVSPAQPFISSFCSHSADQRYEQENGLLSQWRGYGRDGGYCIVFDSERISKLLVEESNAHHWIQLTLGSVRYALEGVSIETLFPRLLLYFDEYVLSHAEGKTTPFPNVALEAFIAGATMYKHQGFKEEREVRIVALPGSLELFNAVSAARRGFAENKIKIIHTSGTAGAKRRHIALFDSLNAALPIRRIIVGPSRVQANNYDHVRQIAGTRFPIILSKTPFIG